MNKKYFIKITETEEAEDNKGDSNSYYLHSPEGIVSYKDKREAKKRIQSLSTFFNLKKNTGIEMIPEERTRKPKDAQAFRWVMVG